GSGGARKLAGVDRIRCELNSLRNRSLQRAVWPPDEPPFKLMADKNSWRVTALVRKVPSIQLVTIVTSDLCTPLVVMHSCAASTTTPTPNGFSTLSRHAAISAGLFPLTLRRVQK